MTDIKHGDEFFARHRGWPSGRASIVVMAVSTPSIWKGEEDQFKWKAHEVLESGAMRNWNPCGGRIWDSWEACVGALEMLGWILVPKGDPQPIDLPVGQDPRQAIEKIAKDLALRGSDAEDRRQGRRLLGALVALWAEDGAEVES